MSYIFKIGTNQILLEYASFIRLNFKKMTNNDDLGVHDRDEHVRFSQHELGIRFSCPMST